ncbi:S49 family peptidase [Rhodococcus sp. HNM0569]|uniref:S49 family peptidase n=1 Tax=Rhodococcus sp. HNM0569 TaxID=2716340 RepID=UPI00146CD6EA|nr:S49 family peptidase [Rhodococcus sp. HNM0569]NLU85065.1 S49 family peptidase [Rhodococcus sp. HNM0569]
MTRSVKLPAALAKRLPGGGAGVVPVVRLHGVIGAAGAGLARPGIAADTVEHPLHAAFTMRGAKAVALSINSPGGSPTQCDYIAQRIRQLSDEHELPVLAFCEDAAASGGYWLACAADEIFASATSMIGSIGVVSGGFGFTGLLDTLGVERRLHAAGAAKVRLDPFSAEDPADVAWLGGVQEQLHAEFRDWVASRRGAKLTGGPDESYDFEELFSGDVWLGRRALELGLIDGIGTLRGVLHERFPDADIRFTSPSRTLLARLGLPAAAAGEAVSSALGAVGSRAAWARLGL